MINGRSTFIIALCSQLCYSQVQLPQLKGKASAKVSLSAMPPIAARHSLQLSLLASLEIQVNHFFSMSHYDLNNLIHTL